MRQTGTGKTAAFALPILHRLDQTRRSAVPGAARPGGLPDPGTGRADRRQFPDLRPASAVPAGRDLWRRGAEPAGPSPGPRGARADRHARPVAGPDEPAPRPVGRTGHVRPGRGGPHAGSGLPAGSEADHRPPAGTASIPVLLGHPARPDRGTLPVSCCGTRCASLSRRRRRPST